MKPAELVYVFFLIAFAIFFCDHCGGEVSSSPPAVDAGRCELTTGAGASLPCGTSEDGGVVVDCECPSFCSITSARGSEQGRCVP